MSNASGTTKTTRWDRAPELPPEIFAAWRKPDGALSPVAIVAAPNIAVSMRGRARVGQERMETNRNRAIVEIEIAEVKNDMVPTLVVENGITISACEEHRERI